jgi:hypothetical protein
MKKYAWIFAVSVLFATGYLMQNISIFPSAGQAVVVDSECSLRAGACEIDSAEFQGVFSIQPNDFQVLQPLQLRLEVRPEMLKNVERVSVEFEGINMDMGYNRVFLEEQNSQNYEATAMLPSCTADTMYWLIHLIIKDSSGVTDFQFQLQTKNP